MKLEQVSWWRSFVVSVVAISFCLGAVSVSSVSAQEGKPPKGQPPKNGQKKDGKEGEKKDGEEKKDDKQSSESVKRPTKPKEEPDPKELIIKPDADGRVEFSFHGQPWPEVLKWLADASRFSLDWQELPGDYLNLVTEKRYTLPEARNLFNRLLLDRGYTMVLQGQVLSVFKIGNLEPSLLPRIEDESELLDLPSYDFVKFTFSLPDVMKADKAAEEVKPLLSPHAKVQPLLSTNRLLVIGTVGNLRAVSELLNAEHAAADSHVVPREFLIRHNRADHVADQVMILLGLDPSSRRSPQELQLEQSRLQLFTQMNQKGKDVTKYLKKGTATVHITVNRRRNSILVNCSPAEMKIIERTIENIDVADTDTPPAMQIGMDGPARMEKYKLVTLDPNSIVNALTQIGDLEPRTQLNVDDKSKTIFAYATPRDHQKISEMIEGLDGSGRQFEVIWLRNLPADRMAATIHALMVGDEDDKSSNSRYGYSYYSYRYGRQEEEDPMKGFRVDADVEKNRLLLWATPTELEEVQKFLVKMGEIPGGGSNPNTVRVLDPRDQQATMRLIEQIRAAWPSIGTNELRIEGVDPRDVATPDEDEEEQVEEPTEEEVPDATTTTRTGRIRDPQLRTRLVQLLGNGQNNVTFLDSGTKPAAVAGSISSNSDTTVQPATASSAETVAAPAAGAPPVTITISPDGRMVLTSKDTAALDRLEDLLKQVAPPAKDYKVFYLKFAFASSVVINLKEYFEDAADFNTEDNWWRAWMGLSFQESEGGKGLASKRKLRFIYDLDTNSILVSNASPEQLATVEQLIEIYDKAPSEEAISARRFMIFKLKHARAEPVAATLKEVYRDLLSSKDKEFAGQKNEENKQSQNIGYTRVYGGVGSDSGSDKKSTKVRTSFAGALSIGVDTVSNTVIISAQEEWIGSIQGMVEYLDNAAEDHKNSVAYGQLAGGLRGSNLQDTLNAMLLEQAKQDAAKGQKQQQQQQQNGQPPQNGQQQNQGN